jgi:hypothetical protein
MLRSTTGSTTRTIDKAASELAAGHTPPNLPMKLATLRIGLLSIILTSHVLAQADKRPFPALGNTYNVTWAKDAPGGKAQIKVLRTGEGSWIFVEYSHLYLPSPPQSQPRPPSGEKPPKPLEWVKSDVNTREMWINTQWLVDATEVNTGN